MMFDSHLRAFRRDSRAPALARNRNSKLPRKAEVESPVEQMVVLLEELSRRIDGLEKKDRALQDEMRQRARKDNRRRSLVTIGGMVGIAVFITCWAMGWV